MVLFSLQGEFLMIVESVYNAFDFNKDKGTAKNTRCIVEKAFLDGEINVLIQDVSNIPQEGEEGVVRFLDGVGDCEIVPKTFIHCLPATAMIIFPVIVAAGLTMRRIHSNLGQIRGVRAYEINEESHVVGGLIQNLAIA
jgi:hypothetical protein